MASQPNSSPQGTWSLTQIDTHYILFTTNLDSGLLQWNSIEKNGVHDDFAPWFSQTFSGLSSTSEVMPLFDSNGTLKIAMIDDLTDQIVSINLYLDSDSIPPPTPCAGAGTAAAATNFFDVDNFNCPLPPPSPFFALVAADLHGRHGRVRGLPPPRPKGYSRFPCTRLEGAHCRLNRFVPSSLLPHAGALH